MIIDIKLVIFPLNNFGVLFVTRLLRQSYNEGILDTEYLFLHMQSLTIFQYYVFIKRCCARVHGIKPN